LTVNWNTTRVRVESAGRVRCERGWRLDASWADKLIDFDLWFVWAGKGIMRTHLGQVDLRPGICFWMRPGGKYVAEQDPSDRLGVTFIHFNLLQAGGRIRPFGAPLPPLINDVADVNFYDSVTRRIVESMQMDAADGKGGRQVASLLLTGLLADLDGRSERRLALPPGAQQQHAQLVSEWVTRITENPAKFDSVAGIANEAGYCADHFSRIFKNVVGQSPQAFLVRCKIDRARQLLLETQLSISQIASALGYEDVFFFSRQFKRKVGCPPTAYRQGRG
jgi:AraC-like DNA-binding protein